MTFEFRLYRILTIIVLIISSFFAFVMLGAVLMTGALPFIIALMVIGACLIHSILSLYLQRSMLIPQAHLKENTPGGIRIMGSIMIIFSIITAISVISYLTASPALLQEAMDKSNMPEDQQQVVKEGGLNGVFKFFLLASIIFITNAILSFRFLKKYKEQQDATDHFHPDDDNLML
ncbi:hypothetical protein ACE38W_09320 [Chitinophaga sp. Hz27]|uniref:hypothetical protein n=1 Tax=Chitinophaga sp. Hz27 TaxID=3347169 RepID=UPI0035E25542